jgi:tetratricopeptide (TPR) repeat protein
VETGDPNTLALTLHDLASDRKLWSHSYTGATEHCVPVETEAIHALAKALDVAITPEAEQRIGLKLSNNLAAWKLVRQVDERFLSRRDTMSEGMQHLNEALQLDPDYLGALTRKAQFLREMTGDRAPNDIWPEIKASGERMMQIDPTSAQGQYFLWATKFLFEWDWEGAERLFPERRARHLDWPVMVAIYLRTVGRFDEARVEQEKVKGLDQRNVSVRQHSTSAAFVERDYRKTIELARELQAMFPGSGYGWDWLFHAYYQLGQFDPALETVRQRRKVYDEPQSMALEACVLAKMEQREAARKLLADLETMSAHRYVDAYPLAWAHLALGDKPAALAKLRQACQQRSEFVVFAEVLAGGLRVDPKLDELRAEPEFQKILKLVGLDVWPKPAAVK